MSRRAFHPARPCAPIAAALLLALGAAGCDDPTEPPATTADAGVPDIRDTTQMDTTQPDTTQPDTADTTDTTQPDVPNHCGAMGDGPTGFAYSWNGVLRPQPTDLPLEGLLDDQYHDGHTTPGGDPTPILPPGRWDWEDGSGDLANWRSFVEHVGTFAPLLDPQGRQYGWRLEGDPPGATDFSGVASVYEGSPGVDEVVLGPLGAIHGMVEGSLGAGPDVLVFDEAWGLDYRTGASPGGSFADYDLVIAGCGAEDEASYQINGASIHTGPCSDLVFARDMAAAAIDLGNGDGGTTSVIDPTDGDDVAVLHGSMKDFRVFGGNGDDTVVWYIDEGKEDITLLGPNFFGGGGSGDAIWGDTGTDRLVLVVPTDTQVIGEGPTPAGALLVTLKKGYEFDIWWDPPVYYDPYARYCITCGVGPGKRHTLTLEYRSAVSPVFTGWFWITAFEELQLGVGPGARVFGIDDVKGTVALLPDAAPFEPPAVPSGYCDPP